VEAFSIETFPCSSLDSKTAVSAFKHFVMQVKQRYMWQGTQCAISLSSGIIEPHFVQTNGTVTEPEGRMWVLCWHFWQGILALTLHASGWAPTRFCSGRLCWGFSKTSIFVEI